MGRPSDAPAEQLARELLTTWVYDETEDRWSIPRSHVEQVLVERAEWRAWALALEAAGRWAR